MKYIIIILTCVITVSAYSQDYYKIYGKVINSDDDKPLAFVSVSILGTFVGIVTNEAGRFELKFSKELLNNTLVVSNLGFRTYQIPLKAYLNKKNSFDIIKLQAQDYYVKEVFITPEAKHPELIVKKAIKAITENYPKNEYYLDIFFRETDYNNKSYLRLIDAAIGIQDFGFIADIHRSRIRLLELRKSNDYLKYRAMWKLLDMLFGEKNILYETYYRDIVRNYKNSRLLDKKTEKFYVFSIDDIIYQDSSVIYIINYEPSKIWEVGDDQSRLMDKKGKLYIKKSDYAIVKTTANYYINGPHLAAGRPIYYTNKSIVNYRKIKGKYYLNYLKHTKGFEGTPLYNENGKQKKQTTESSFYVTNIYTTKKEFDRVKLREKQQKYIDLYKTEIPYNESFWESYNSVLRNPLLLKAKKDLEKDESLEEQFKDNG